MTSDYAQELIELQEGRWAKRMGIVRQTRATRARRKFDGSKSVICLEDGMVFDSIVAAAKHYGCHHSTIVLQLQGKLRTAAGKHFEFMYPKDKNARLWPDEKKKQFAENRLKYHKKRKEAENN